MCEGVPTLIPLCLKPLLLWSGLRLGYSSVDVTETFHTCMSVCGVCVCVYVCVCVCIHMCVCVCVKIWRKKKHTHSVHVCV